MILLIIMKKKNLVTCIILSIVTLGIYTVFWTVDVLFQTDNGSVQLIQEDQDYLHCLCIFPGRSLRHSYHQDSEEYTWHY